MAASLAVLVSPLAAAGPAGATFPGGNGKIAFTHLDGGQADVYVMNPDGSGRTRLTAHPAFDSEPAWSGDGARIAFNSSRNGGVHVFVMNADGTGVVQLTSTGDNPHPEWTSDGRIVFASNRDGDFEIFVMNADGTGVTQLTHNTATDFLPAPAPGEPRVAWTSEVDGDQDIYVMGLDGSEVVQVTNHPSLDALPSWSPRGNRLAFISERDYPLSLPQLAPPDDGELYTVDANGKNLARLTTTVKRSEIVPAWSPDGETIAVTGCIVVVFPNHCDLYEISADGSGEKQLTTDGASFQPDWQAIAPRRGGSAAR